MSAKAQSSSPVLSHKVRRHLGQDPLLMWTHSSLHKLLHNRLHALLHSSKHTPLKGDKKLSFQLVSQSSESREFRVQVLHLSTAETDSLLRGCTLGIYHSGTQSSLWYHTEWSMLGSRRRTFSSSSVCFLPFHTDLDHQVENLNGCQGNSRLIGISGGLQDPCSGVAPSGHPLSHKRNTVLLRTSISIS